MRFSIVAGDLKEDLNFTCEVNGAAVDLTTADTIEMLWRRPDGTEVTLELEEVDLDLGQVKYDFVAGDTDIVGIHRARVVVTWPSSQPQTFPSDGTWFLWSVHE